MNSENSTDYDRGKATGVKLGALTERRRFIALIESLPFTWYGEKQNIDISKADLLALVAERKEND